MNDSDKSANYWPALDGLRGVAVIAVVLFHAGATWLQGGFLGVDVFFVLSGFLITSQLLAEQSTFGRIALKGFFYRRAVRLQPALWTLLVGYLCLWFVGWVPATGAVAMREVFIAAVGFANWARAFDFWMPDYLGHMWSLAIEEQFYLIWAIFLAKWWGSDREITRATFVMAAVICVASIAAMYIVFTSGSTASRAYNGLDTRAFALLLGATLAAHFAGRFPPTKRLALASNAVQTHWCFQWAPMAAFSSIVALFYFARWTAHVMYPWGYLLIAVLTTVVIWQVVAAKTTNMKCLLENRVIVYVGKVSYGYYLWHYPILRIAAHKAADFGISVVASQIWGVVVSFLFALASYHLVEQPVRRAYKRSRLSQST